MKVTTEGGQPDLPGGTAAAPLQIDTPSSSCPITREPPTRPPSKENGKLPPTLKETNILGGGIIDKPAPWLPLTVGSAFPHFARALVEN